MKIDSALPAWGRRAAAYAAVLAIAVASMGAVSLGAAVPDFSLKTPDGKDLALATLQKGPDGAKLPVVVSFWSFKCPSGKSSMERYGEVASNAEAKGARFIGVCAYGETADAIAKYAKENNISYPLGVDGDKKVIALLGAAVVTETFVLDKDGKLVYKGGLGEANGAGPEAALADLAAGKPVAKPETRARG